MVNQDTTMALTLVIGSQRNVWSKRCFIISLLVAVIFIFYLATLSISDNAVSIMNIFPASFKQGLQGFEFSFSNKQKWQQTNLNEVFDLHKPRTNESCINVCDTEHDRGCNATTAAAWKALMLAPNFTFMPLLSENQYIYPFEVDYLSYPPLKDEKELPNLTLSKVYVYGAVNEQVFCAINDVIKGRVDLVDGHGKQRIMGGDEVRVWVVDGQTKKFKATGHVTDLTNGSYQISFTCLWPGKIQLNVAVVYPREYLRIVIGQIRRGVMWFYAAKFKSQNEEEVTLCLSTPNIPGRPCLCNFTSTNQQSLYCGRPLKGSLGCDDWVETFSLPIPLPHDVSPAENKLVHDIPKAILTKVIPHKFNIFANNTGSPPALKLCTETSPNVTWEIQNQPSGYWTPEKAWTSLICQRPKMTSEWATACLKNTNVWVFGDSNGIRLIYSLLGVVKTVSVKSGDWPYQSINMQKVNGITITFTPLEYPLFLGQIWRPRLRYGGVAKQIDSIPSTGKHVIIIHYYLHIIPSHLSIVFTRLIAVHDAVLRLINKNPNVLVAIRGPHVSSVEFDYNHAVGGDNLGVHLLEMIRHVFDDIKHKVVFLDGWDMTAAMENESFHPDNVVPFEMLRTLLAFKCS